MIKRSRHLFGKKIKKLIIEQLVFRNNVIYIYMMPFIKMYLYFSKFFIL